jgi:hypothetical protein
MEIREGHGSIDFELGLGGMTGFDLQIGHKLTRDPRTRSNYSDYERENKSLLLLPTRNTY